MHKELTFKRNKFAFHGGEKSGMLNIPSPCCRSKEEFVIPKVSTVVINCIYLLISFQQTQFGIIKETIIFHKKNFCIYFQNYEAK